MARRSDRPRQRQSTPRQGGGAATSARPLPHDLDAENALLGSALVWADTVPTVAALPPETFYSPRNQRIADTIRHIHTNGTQTVSPALIAADLRQGGPHDDQLNAHLVHLQAVAVPRANTIPLAELLTRLHRRRETAKVAQAIQEAAGVGEDTGELEATLEQLRAATATRTNPVDIDSFLNAPEDDYDWLIPGLLERTDRVVLTAAEGVGKSTLIRQIAVQTAAGIHPFTHTAIPPARVLLVDFENSRRHVRRKLRALRLQAGDQLDPQLLYIECRPQGVDLLDSDDASWFANLVDAVAPDLVVGGPIYKMAAGNPNQEEETKPVALYLDRLRDRHRCTMILEAHIGNGEGGRRPQRPVGWSGWRRWPEFGLYLSETGVLTHWRGDRDERDWPFALTKGGKWPWMPTDKPADNPPNSTSDDARTIDQAVLEYIEKSPVPVSRSSLRDHIRGYSSSRLLGAVDRLAETGKVHETPGTRGGRLYLPGPGQTGMDWDPLEES